MHDKLYVGLGHKARQGKDSIARLINIRYPALTRVMGFADALKTYCRVAKGMKEKDAPLLQEVGVSMRENWGRDIWIEALKWTAQDYPQPIILIPDVRFANEAKFITDHDGALVRVRRLMEDGSQFVPTDRDPLHESETALDDYPWEMTIDIADDDIMAMRREASRLGASIVVGFNERLKQRLAQEGPRVVLH